VKERSVPIRPGIEEHLVRGAMSLGEFGIYALIHIQADYRTGIWRGSAPRVLATAPRGASLRQVQRALEHFEEMGYLKSFRVQGARGNTPYLIDKFTVRSGALKGYRVNAAKSESWQRPFYELVAEDDAVPVAEDDALSRSKKKEVREKKHPTPSALGATIATTHDSLDQETRDAAFEVFWEAWPRKQAKGTARRAWQKIPNSEYLAITAGLNRWRSSDQWTRGVIPHPSTWLNEERWQDEDIPQFVGGTNANANRKPTATDLAMQNARALGLSDKPVN
jgi:hypothetical protein